MKTIRFQLLLATVLWVGAITPALSQMAVYYVSPTGSDANAGTFSQPFATLAKAQSVVRSVNANMTGDIVVYLRAGTYALTNTLAFGPADSGTDGYNVIYRAYSNEVPIISGGKTVTGWTLHDSTHNIWQASVATSDNFRQIYVNGVKATRACSTGADGCAYNPPVGYSTTDMNLQNYGNITNMELVVHPQGWQQDRIPIASISGTNITIQQPSWNALITSQFGGSGVTRLENAYEYLQNPGTPGTWYLNLYNHTLYYIPNSGENLTNGTSTVEVPVVEQLIAINGTATSPVNNLQFIGLSFRLANWLQPSTGQGLFSNQANQNAETNSVTAAFNAIGAQNVAVIDCNFYQLGGDGINFLTASHGDEVAGCSFWSIAASALQIGAGDFADSYLPLGSPDIVSSIVVTGCTVHDVCTDYQAGCGILVGYTESCTVSHNTVYNVPYTGISMGWGWGYYDAAFSINNQVLDNKVYNHMQSLVDGGGIYVLGAEQNALMSGNYTYNQGNFYTACLYLDEGSSGWLITSNVVEIGLAEYWLFFNSGGYNVATDNYSDSTSEGSPGGAVVSNTTLFSDGSPPAAALAIMNAAGAGGLSYDLPATNGTFVNNIGGDWNASANWAGGTIASGRDMTANFDTLSLASDTTATLDTQLTIGNLVFGDTTSNHNWFVNSAGGVLTIETSSGSPSINVSNQTTTLNCPLAGTEGFVKTGTGRLALNGVNTYSGATTVNQGTLTLNSTISGASAVNVASGATLDCEVNNSFGGSPTAPWTIAGTLTGDGSVGAQSLPSGGVSLNGGTMNGSACTTYGTFLADTIDTITANGTGNTISSGNVGLTTPLTFLTPLTTDALSVSAALGASSINTGSVIKAGNGTVTLSGVNTYTGSTTISAGTLTIGGAGQLGSGNYAGVVTNNGAFIYDSSAAQTLSGTLCGTGSLTEAGSGTLTLNGVNTYSGPTTVNQGTLTLNSMISGASVVNVASGAILDCEVNNSFGGAPTAPWTIAGTFTGDGSMGAQTLPTGGVTLNGGTMNGSAFSIYGTFLADNAVTITANGSGNTISSGNFGLSSPVTFLTPLTTDALSVPAVLGAPSLNTGSVIKAGHGTVTLSGVNTYSGATTVSQGTLALNNTISGASTVNVASGATLVCNVNNSFGGAPTAPWTIAGTLTGNGSVGAQSLPTGGVTLNGGTMNGSAYATYGTFLADAAVTITANGTGNTISSGNFGLTTPVTLLTPLTTDTLSVSSALGTSSVNSGSVIKTGSGTVTLSGVNTYTGGTTVNQGTLALNNTISGASAVNVSSGATLVCNVNNCFGGSPTAPWTIAGTITGNGSGAQSLPSGGVTLNGGTMNGSAYATYGTFLADTIDTTTANGTGNTLSSGNVGLNTPLTFLTPLTTDTLSVSAVLGAASVNSGSVIKTGSGTVTLSGVNTYTGSTTISAGTLTIGGAGQLGSGSYAGVITNNGAFIYNSSAAQTLSGNLSGTGSLAEAGSGTLTLNGVNTYTGPTTISSGTLTIGGAGQLGSGSYAGAITNNGAFIYNSSAAQTLSGNLSGTGSLTEAGSGTLTLNGVNNYSGATTVNQSTLTLNSTISSASTVNVASGATLVCNVNNCFGGSPTAPWTIAGTITGNGSAGAQSLPSGGVTLNGGTMSGSAYAAYGTFLADTIDTITANGTGNTISSGNVGLNTPLTFLTPLTTDALSVSAVLGASSVNNGSVIKTGKGTVTLSGANTYSGTTSVSNGVLVVNGALSTNTVTVARGASLGGYGIIRGKVTVNSGGTLALGASIGTLTISNKLTLNGTNIMKVSHVAAATNDVVTGLTTITYGGTLTVITNGVLQAGDTFRLFKATTYAGTFAVTNLPSPGPGLAWNASGLTNGTLQVVAHPGQQIDIPPTPGFNQPPVSLGNGRFQISFSGTSGTDYRVWATTDLTLSPITSTWSNVTSGTFGDTPVTYTDTNNYSTRFYEITVP